MALWFIKSFLAIYLLQFNSIFTKIEKKAIRIICKRVARPHMKTNHLIKIIKITLNSLKTVCYKFNNTSFKLVNTAC